MPGFKYIIISGSPLKKTYEIKYLKMTKAKPYQMYMQAHIDVLQLLIACYTGQLSKSVDVSGITIFLKKVISY